MIELLRDSELDALKSEEKEAFRRKQEAFKRYRDAKERTDEAYEVMQRAWEELRIARDEMNREYEALQQAKEYNREVWDEYGRIRDYNNSRIETLRYEADCEHQMMKDCFERASDAYNYGDKADASLYSAEGHEHKDRRDELNAEIGALIQEIRDAKENAKWRAPKVDSSAFYRAKEAFNNAKARHESAKERFKYLKEERNRLKAELDSAKGEHARLKERLRQRLEEVKAKRQHERDRILDKAGVRYSERKDAKVVKKSDGTTQIYHGGIGKGDGLGHGHVALDQFGNKIYDRDAFEKHGSQNYTDSQNSRGGWTQIQRGTIDGHEVTFRQGIGVNSGQTLISDGHISGKQFDRHHSHYGDNDKSRYPDEPDRIEDSSRHKNDDAYTGPGH